MESTRPLKTPSVTDAVSSHIRQLILDGTLAPGLAPSIESFAAMLDVSTTPVREAMKRLEFEGLVEIRPRSGVYVRDISPMEMHEVSVLRELLNPLEARWAAERASAEEKQTLLDICERLVAAATDDDFDAYSLATEERSAVLRAMAHSSLLDSLFLAMESRVRPVRYRSIARTGRFKEAAAEHYEIALAVAQGDAGKAADLAQSHVLAARRNLNSYALQAEIGTATTPQAPVRPRARSRSAGADRGRYPGGADAPSRQPNILDNEEGPI